MSKIIGKMLSIAPYITLEQSIIDDFVGSPVKLDEHRVGIVTKAWVEDNWVMVELELDKEQCVERRMHRSEKRLRPSAIRSYLGLDAVRRS